jgi:hypothetical protein
VSCFDTPKRYISAEIDGGKLHENKNIQKLNKILKKQTKQIFVWPEF